MLVSRLFENNFEDKMPSSTKSMHSSLFSLFYSHLNLVKLVAGAGAGAVYVCVCDVGTSSVCGNATFFCVTFAVAINIGK